MKRTGKLTTFLARVWHGCLVLTAVGLAYGVADVAHACETVQLTVNWTQLENEDADGGDLVEALQFPARGARVTVIRPYPEPAIGMFLDEEGHGSFDSQFATGHKVIVYAEAVLGIGTGGQIHIKTYPSVAAKNNDEDSIIQTDVPSMPNDWSIVVDASETGKHQVTLLATTTEVLYRLHWLDGSLLNYGHTLKIWLDPEAQNASVPTDEEIRVGTAGDDLGVSALRKKFIMGHEIGHWIQRQIAGDWLVSYDYGPDTSGTPLDPAMTAEGNPWDEPCRFAVEVLLGGAVNSNPNRHGIRSAEFSSGAMPEGFGHFVASVAFNSDLGEDADGEFKYYKEPADNLPSYVPFKAGGGDRFAAGWRGTSRPSRWRGSMGGGTVPAGLGTSPSAANAGSGSLERNRLAEVLLALHYGRIHRSGIGS